MGVGGGGVGWGGGGGVGGGGGGGGGGGMSKLFGLVIHIHIYCELDHHPFIIQDMACWQSGTILLPKVIIIWTLMNKLWNLHTMILIQLNGCNGVRENLLNGSCATIGLKGLWHHNLTLVRHSQVDWSLTSDEVLMLSTTCNDTAAPNGLHTCYRKFCTHWCNT